MLYVLIPVALLAGCTAPTCTVDADCDDGNPCTGVETCDAGACLAGVSPICEGDLTCFVEEPGPVCDTLCRLPELPRMSWLAEREVITLPVGVEVAVDGGDWAAADWLMVPEGVEQWAVRARFEGADCERQQTYEIGPSYPGAADTPGSVAVPASQGARWADRVVDVQWGTDIAEQWQDPDLALGVAEGGAESVVPLGRGGSIVLGFDPPLRDGSGADLAVFENSFTDGFLELAFVEVSTDGTRFARFDAASRTPAEVDPYGEIDPTDVGGLAGDVRQGFGTPFDLAVLADHDLVRTGQLELDRVRYVRVIDVIGDGREIDFFGRPIYDPFPTVGTAGFDLDGVAALEER